MLFLLKNNKIATSNNVSFTFGRPKFTTSPGFISIFHNTTICKFVAILVLNLVTQRAPFSMNSWKAFKAFVRICNRLEYLLWKLLYCLLFKKGSMFCTKIKWSGLWLCSLSCSIMNWSWVRTLALHFFPLFLHLHTVSPYFPLERWYVYW